MLCKERYSYLRWEAVAEFMNRIFIGRVAIGLVFLFFTLLLLLLSGCSKPDKRTATGLLEWESSHAYCYRISGETGISCIPKQQRLTDEEFLQLTRK